MSLSFGELLRSFRMSAGLTQEDLAELAGVTDRGIRYLERGLRRPHRDTARRLAAALGLDDRDEARFVAAARPARGAALASDDLPVSPYPLIGREQDAREIRRLLGTDGLRLLTVTGPGGVGKTSLALEVAGSLRETFMGGVAWVPLASLTDPALVPQAVARGMGLVESGAIPLLEALPDALDGRPILVVLDNVEHLAAGAFVAELVDSCPQLKVLATSRAPLRLRTEHEFSLSPLSVPEGLEGLPVYAIAANPAVDLFLRRAQAARPAFALTESNAGHVVEICRRLDGLPLALELAAARVRVLAPRLMLARLTDRLGFLTGGGDDMPVRQRTMRETVAWSYDLLAPSEQPVLAHLAVFDGSFHAAAAEAVLLPQEPGTLLDAVESMQRVNLLLTVETAEDEPRFRMLGTVRDFALEILASHPEARQLHERHATYYVALAERAAKEFYGSETARWLDVLEEDHDNIRAASRWLLDRGDAAAGLRLCASLWWYWYVRGYASEGRTELGRFLALPGSVGVTRPRAGALLGSGQLAQTQGDYEAARMFLAESIRLYRSIGDDRDTAAALLAAGFTARLQEEYEVAHSLLGEALVAARSSGASFVVAASLHHLGMIAADAEKDLGTAETLLEESLALYRDLGFPRFVALLLLSLGDVACAKEDHPRARRLLVEGLSNITDAGEKLGVHGALDSLARLAADTGDDRRAVTLAAAAQRLRTATGSRSWPVVERQRDRLLDRARRVLPDQELASAWTSGASMTMQQAVSYGLQISVEPEVVEQPSARRALIEQDRTASSPAALAHGSGDAEPVA